MENISASTINELFIQKLNSPEGLEKVAGGKLLTMLDKSLNNPLKQGLFGTVATALMQSSGLLMKWKPLSV